MHNTTPLPNVVIYHINLGWFGGKVLNNFYFYFLVMFNNKNNNSLQFDLKPNNEAIVLESFIQKICMLGTYF
jgi:hypothetical protein